MVVVARLANVLGGKHGATLPAPARVFLLDLHPVWLVFLRAVAPAAYVTVANVRGDHERVLHRALALENRVLHVENIHTFHFTQKLESLQTGGLVDIRGDRAGLGTGTNQRRVWACDLGQVRRGLGLQFGAVENNSG